MNSDKQIAGWKPAPFIRLLFPLMTGIIVEKFFPVQPGYLFGIFCLSFVLFIYCSNIPFSRFFGMEWIPGLAIQIAFFSFGRILMFTNLDLPVERSPYFLKNGSNCLLLRILSDPVSKQNSLKCEATIRWLTKDQACFHEKEKIIVYFNKKLDSRQLKRGSLVIFRKALQPIENLKIFGGFDYKKYCALKHIYAQVFLNENEFALLGNEKDNSILSLLDRLRKKLLETIKKQIPVKSENSLLEALMVGFSEDLDPGLMKSYADTGVIHIIAISGLHLALICHILQLSLKGIGEHKTSQWVKFVIIVCILWSYSFLSGSSPSVIRAATMFTLTLLGRNLTRESAFYNGLAASAFLLLCFDPFWIWDTGFQLSYAAILSLRMFAKPLGELLPLQNKMLVAIRDAASVSMAAQILTTPVSIYYFHRFPSYFLIANLVAVPLSSGILVGGIFLCLFSFLNPLGRLMGWLLGLLIEFLNGFIRYVSHLPGAVIADLTLSLPQVVIVYITIFCFYRFLRWKENKWLLVSLGSVCLFQILGLIH